MLPFHWKHKSVHSEKSKYSRFLSVSVGFYLRWVFCPLNRLFCCRFLFTLTSVFFIAVAHHNKHFEKN